MVLLLKRGGVNFSAVRQPKPQSLNLFGSLVAFFAVYHQATSVPLRPIHMNIHISEMSNGKYWFEGIDLTLITLTVMMLWLLP
jgi:hypothetical protein